MGTARRTARALSRTVAVAQRHIYNDAAMSGPNAAYLESVYEQWKTNPKSLGPQWTDYFEAMESSSTASSLAVKEGSTAATSMGGGLQNMIRAYQKSGHRGANLCPLGLHDWRDWAQGGGAPELSLA